jgi:DNA-binding PadR family transcriptional regulator
MTNPDLNPLDHQIMLAILRRQPTAYGIAIQNEIETRTDRSYSVGAVYAALDRLEQKGLVYTKMGEATPQRGGRRKLYFFLTAPGQATLQRSLNALDSMRRGLKLKEARA